MPNKSPFQAGGDLSAPGVALSSFLGCLPTLPRLLALGEPTHGLDAFPAWRNRLFIRLVEEHGYRSVALESDIIAGLRVDAYVTRGQGELDEVMRTGFSHGFGSLRANRELVAWMREFNIGRGAADQVRFYGFDAPLEFWAPSPRASLLALHAFLTERVGEVPVDAATLERLCGDDADWANPASVLDAAQSIGGSDEARILRRLADDLMTLLHTEAPELASQVGFWEAQLHARTAQGLLRYHALLADPAPNRDRLERASALRDLMMADHLSAIVEREGERGPTLAFAHNAHLQRWPSTMKMGELRVKWWSAGAHVSLRLGERYTFIAGDLGRAPGKGVGSAAPGTLQGVLMNPAHPARLFRAEDLIAALPDPLEPRRDAPSQAGYFPLEARHLPLMDGLLFLSEAAD
ncbi:Erythromycin esterase homolog [Deinococcus reticulitermitis]|uniref:Erythromycin esterase homolog n=2 Tax=Deinococcus reticulitermitis TaxID=856736 RepID=A0A1H7A4K9_9DEIO|nr:Erythromycin esterase homolog [Deinococcus reticulitermitis]